MDIGSVLVFIFQLFLLVLVIMGCLIVLVAVAVGGVQGIRRIGKNKTTGRTKL